MTSWADALQQHSPDELLTLMQEKRRAANDAVQALDHIIATLESVVSSDALWEKVTVPGPRAANSPQADSGPPDPADSGPAESDGGEHLAHDAEEALGPEGDGGCVPPRPGPADEPTQEGRPTRRMQILTALTTSPAKWWSAEELCAAIGVDNHRKLRGILSEMVRGGQLMKHKEPGRKHVFYRLAPASATHEGQGMSG